MKFYRKSNKLLQEWQPLLWSSNIKNIDLERDRSYVIHQILMYGALSDIKQLFRIYSKKELKDIFTHSPRKIYTKPAFEFIKKIILGIKTNLNSDNYVKSFS